MKRILIAILICFCLTSCVEEFKGNYGVVESVELVHPYGDNPIKWKYKITVKHTGNNVGQYKMYTNEEYHPGDTMEIHLKPKYEPEEKPETKTNYSPYINFLK